MVYCGKPSGGCHACREKKTRCDQKPDGCTQCMRAKRVCPGYRALGDVIFRNESDNVVRKFKAKEARAKTAALIPSVVILSPASTGESEGGSEDSLELVQRGESPLSCFSLATNIEDQATAYFITNYVVNEYGPTRGHLDYLTNICGEDGVGESLLASMKAVGLAGVAHKRCAPSLMKSARYQYVKALEATNAALKSPSRVKNDSTLTAIVVLSIFETVTGCNQKSIKDWAEHIMGAAALLKVRGIEQLNSIRGRRMFVQVTSSLMISCIQRGTPLPPHVIEWTNIAKSKITGKVEPAFLFHETMMKWTMLRASIQSGSLSDPQVIIDRALELDAIFVSIFETDLPPDWKYQTVFSDVKADCIYNGRYDVYFDYWIAQIWNAMRSMRVLLNETIRDNLLAGFSSKPPYFTGPEYTKQFQRSTDVCFEMQAGILASVPQHLGYVSSSHISGQELGDNQSLMKFSHVFPNVSMAGPLFLLWPLWFSGIMDIATEEIQRFVINNLRTIGETMGIQQAVVLAKVIETKSGITVW